VWTAWAKASGEWGWAREDRIAVLAKNSLEYFLLFGAASALGAVMLPVNWRLSPDEIAFILQDGEPKILFTDGDSGEVIQTVKKRVPSVEKHLELGPGVASLMESEGPTVETEVAADDGLVIIYTAAVAGRPRGAVLSHGNVLCANMHFNYLMNVTAGDVHLCFLPIFPRGRSFYDGRRFSRRRTEHQHEPLRCGESGGSDPGKGRLFHDGFLADPGFHPGGA
jgi:long-subunit acyl-CoA synthetase (AMP-forming)